MSKGIFAKFYHNISIRTKLIVILCILVSFPIIIIGYFGYQNYVKITEEKFINYSQKDVKELASLLTERIEKLINFSQEILYDNNIYDASSEMLSSKVDDVFSEYVFKSNFEKYLRSILFSRSELDMILYQFSSNKKTCYVDRSLSSNIDAITPLSSIYEYAKSGKGKPVWYLEQQKGKVSGIYLARIIYDRNTLNEIGMIVFKVNKEYMFGVFSDFLSNKDQNVSIYSNNNLELFSFNTFQSNYQDSIDKLLNTNAANGVHEIRPKNDKVYIIYNTVAPLDWKLVVSISTNILLKEVRDVSKTVILLCLITLPIWIILINLLYIDIIKPMNLLIDKMHNIEKGNMGVIVESNRRDELGYVFKTFNKMSQEINYLINCVYKKQLAIKDAEIKALQSQINPHFLFNTLETINWKAKLCGNDEISDMIAALSSIIEANIDRNNEIMIPLYKEVEYIDNYNLLITKRFGKKIKFKKSVQTEALNCEIPRLIIQPLIENSIYHGLETKKGGGTIELTIKIEDYMVDIKVEDNGLGIEENVLEQLKENLQREEEQHFENYAHTSSKIGVMNVHKRIKLLYGEKYGLEISSELGVGTTINIKLPIRVHKGVKVYD